MLSCENIRLLPASVPLKEALPYPKGVTVVVKLVFIIVLVVFTFCPCPAIFAQASPDSC